MAHVRWVTNATDIPPFPRVQGQIAATMADLPVREGLGDLSELNTPSEGELDTTLCDEDCHDPISSIEHADDAYSFNHCR